MVPLLSDQVITNVCQSLLLRHQCASTSITNVMDSPGFTCWPIVKLAVGDISAPPLILKIPVRLPGDGAGILDGPGLYQSNHLV